MRILFISNLYPPLAVGGYEQICFDVAQGLKGRGHQVQVLTSSYRLQDAPNSEAGIYRLLKLKSSYGLPGPHSSEWFGRNRIELERHNSRIVGRAIARLKPDTTMFWNGGNMGRSLLSAAEQSGRVVYYLHDPWLAPVLLSSRDRGWARLRRDIYYKLVAVAGIPGDPVPANGMIFASRALQSQYRGMGVNVSKTVVIPNGLSPSMFHFQSPHILQRQVGEPYMILYSGRIAPQKGVSTLVTALGKVRTIPGLEHTKLSLLGQIEGEAYGSGMRVQIAELHLADAVEFLPRRSRHELPEVYSQYDVLAFPSEWEEPFGLVLVEAMATGLPVVSSLMGAPGEIVRDGENALAFEAGNADDLAQKLAWMLTHPHEAAAMGRVASEEIHQHYTLEAQVEAVEAYLQDLVSHE